MPLLPSILIAILWFAALAHAAHDLWAASLLFTITTLSALLFILGRLRNQRPIKLPLLPALTVLLLAFGLSFWHTYDVEATHIEFWNWAFSLLIFYLFVNLVETPEARERFFLLAGCVVVPLAVICIGQQLLNRPYNYGVWEARLPGMASPLLHLRYGHWEIPSTLINSTVLAGFILHWPLLFWDKSRQDKRYQLPFYACVVALLLARSWFAIAAFLLGFAVYYRTYLAKVAARHKKICMLAAAFLAFVALNVVYLKVHQRPEDFRQEASYHSGARLAYWKAALAMGTRSPVHGVGLGSFATAYPYFKSSSFESTRFAHSFPLELFAETGIPGLAAFVLIISGFLRMRFRKKEGLSVFDITLGVVLAFSLVNINLDFLVNKITLLLFVGACLTGAPAREITIPKLWLACAGICLALLIPFWLNLWVASRFYTAGIIAEQRGDRALAIHAYKQAISLEPYHARSYWQLANIYHQQYLKSRSPADLAAAQACLQQVIRYKKDVLFFPKPA